MLPSLTLAFTTGLVLGSLTPYFSFFRVHMKFFKNF